MENARIMMEAAIAVRRTRHADQPLLDTQIKYNFLHSPCGYSANAYFSQLQKNSRTILMRGTLNPTNPITGTDWSRILSKSSGSREINRDCR